MADLQFRLRWLDLYGGRLNGTYNQRLTDSVLAYQQSRGITSDLPGQYGPATRAALQHEVPDIVSD
ncbi:peptidoglycan-binding domain-containing protein [Streptomyces sp. C10-9-1]|uniref:peptidoglycan-binding domain-containing protein n=1 Tax=Streptomyces sp. C10-9-1 TaxID=1859285 RepID=UPI003D73D969